MFKSKKCDKEDDSDNKLSPQELQRKKKKSLKLVQ